jgi:hypothetical protein
LVGGDHLDVVYDEASVAADDIVEHIISTLAQDGGMPPGHHEAQIDHDNRTRHPVQ